MTGKEFKNKSKKQNFFNPSTPIAFGEERKYQLLLTILGLIAIIVFAIFLRYEDFPVWQKHKAAFQYGGAYQMASFDSYYYLQVAKDLQNGNYSRVDEKRQVPNGVEGPLIPPLLSILAAGIHKLTNLPISLIAIFIPIFLSSLLALLVFAVGRELNLNNAAALTASLFSIISLTYVVRTRIGVFDTDCLNVSLALQNSYFFLRFAKIESTKRYTYLTLGLLTTFLYLIWWQTAGSVVILSAMIPLSVALIFFYKTKKVIFKYCMLGMLILVTVYFFSDQMLSYFELLFHQKNSAYTFPNNISVVELNAVSLNNFIQGTVGNKFIFGIMLLGLGYFTWKEKLRAFFFVMPVAMGLLPFFSGNRFMIFSAPVLALGMGYAVQCLFDLKNQIKPLIAYVIVAFLVLAGILSNYSTITDNFVKPAVADNITLLDALKKNTAEAANIWTDWDLGYQIHHYLDRGTFADGEFIDGEIYFYLSYPLAANNLAVAANFIRFYNQHGIAGMHELYALFSGVKNTFTFLDKILSFTPAQAEEWLGKRKNLLPQTKKMTTSKQWVLFLFPEKEEDIYLFLHYKMSQTASWFKQGNVDLKTGKTKGLPLFLTFSNLKEEEGIIKNNQININSTNGIGNHINGTHYFQHLLTYDGVHSKKKVYAPSALHLRRNNSTGEEEDTRFAFQWNKKNGFGAAMSQEMANTTFAKLYLQEKKSPYFEPVSLRTPQYQVWKITGNREIQ